MFKTFLAILTMLSINVGLAQADFIKVELFGPVTSVNGSSGRGSGFSVGDAVSYSFVFDDQVVVPRRIARSGFLSSFPNSIESFSGSVGSYSFGGNCAGVLLRDDFDVTFDPSRGIEDMFLLNTANAELNGYANGITGSDFTSGDPVNGFPLTSFWLDFMDPSHSLLNDLRFNEGVFTSFQSVPDLLSASKFSLFFDGAVEDEEGIRSMDIGVIGAFNCIKVTNLGSDPNANPDTSGIPCPTFGVVINSMSNGGRFPDHQDSFSATVNDFSKLQIWNFGGSRGGSSAGRGKTSFGGTLPDGTEIVPGLEVGVFARGDGLGEAAAHALTFRTYTYHGAEAMNLVLHATISGKFRPDWFDLPNGPMGALGEVTVVDTAIFENILPDDPALLELFFFDIPHKNTTLVRSSDLFNERPARLFVGGELASSSWLWSRGDSVNDEAITLPSDVFHDFDIHFTVSPGQQLPCYLILPPIQKVGQPSVVVERAGYHSLTHCLQPRAYLPTSSEIRLGLFQPMEARHPAPPLPLPREISTGTAV